MPNRNEVNQTMVCSSVDCEKFRKHKQLSKIIVTYVCVMNALSVTVVGFSYYKK